MRFLYSFSKVTGLVPFYFDFDKNRAFPSITAVLYSAAFAVILSSYLTYYAYVLSGLIMDMDDDLVIVLVLIVDMVTAYLKTVSFYILQLVQRHKIIELINSLIRILELVSDQDSNEKLTLKSFFDKKLTNSCRTKCVTVCIQIFSLITAFSIYQYNVSLYYTLQNVILILFTNITTTIVISIFYCGSMLFSARLYQILSAKIMMLSTSCDENQNQNEIEQISFLYEHVTVFTTKICQIYAFQIIISLVGIIVWILASVRIGFSIVCC